MDGSRIRKEKVADSKVPGYVWTRLAEKRLYWAAKTLEYISLRFLSRIKCNFPASPWIMTEFFPLNQQRVTRFQESKGAKFRDLFRWGMCV